LKREFVRDRESRSGGGRYSKIRVQTSMGRVAIAKGAEGGGVGDADGADGGEGCWRTGLLVAGYSGG